jgi:hypothetical protein
MTQNLPDSVSTNAQANDSEEDTIGAFIRTNEGKIVSPVALVKFIRTEAGELDEGDMQSIPMLDRFESWGGIRWEVGLPPPAPKTPDGRHPLEDYEIVFIFTGDLVDEDADHLPGDARIYVAPKTEAISPSKSSYLVYTMSRVHANGGHRRTMPLRAFLEAASYELNRLAVACEVLEDGDDDEPKQAS